MQYPENNSANNDLLAEVVKGAESAYQVPASAFDSYRVKRGLREPDGTGVMAGVTHIGNAHGYVISEGERTSVEGELYYRGYPLSSLCENFVAEGRFGFAECCYLLFFGHLPNPKELSDFTTLMDNYSRLPARFDEDILMKAPCPSIMNKIATGVFSLYAYDENPDDTSLSNMLRQSMEVVAKIPVIAAHAYAVYRNVFEGRSLSLNNPHAGLAVAENFLRMLRSNKTFTAAEAHLLDLCLVVHAEHGGGNNSTFACRVLSSSGTDTYSAVGAAIGALKGPLHGGANIKVQEMFDAIKKNLKDPRDDEEVSLALRDVLDGKIGDGSGLIYGMGHAIYTKSDPRAVILKHYARNLANEKGYGEDFALLESIERLTPEVFRKYKGSDKEMCANVDLYSGLIYRMLGIPVCMYTPLFAIARSAGWCAHRMEELLTGKRIIRPAYKCITPVAKYIPMDKRS